MADDSAITQAGTIIYSKNNPILRMMSVLNPQFHWQFVLKLEGQGFNMSRLNQIPG